MLDDEAQLTKITPRNQNRIRKPHIQSIARPSVTTNAASIREEEGRESTLTDINVFRKVRANPVPLKGNAIHEAKTRFIAIDTETTGLNDKRDRVIELAAVIFEKGKPQNEFSTLVKSPVPISSSARKVNHISDDMLVSAPSEPEAFQAFIRFIGDAMQGKTLLVAHHAVFDISFLRRAFLRLGIEADLRYMDTLAESRTNIEGLRSYKLSSVASHLRIKRNGAHRALADAFTCGMIMCRLIKRAQKAEAALAAKRLEKRPTDEELEVCAVIMNCIASRGGTTEDIGYYRDTNGYVSAWTDFPFARFKFAKRGRYLIVEAGTPTDGFETSPCSKSEGGTDNIRVHFYSPLELNAFGDYFYRKHLEPASSFYGQGPEDRRFVRIDHDLECVLDWSEVEDILAKIELQE